MKKITTLQMIDDDLEFSVDVPSLEVIDQIADIYDEIDAKRKNILAGMDPKLFTFLQNNAHRPHAETIQDALDQKLISAKDLLQQVDMSTLQISRAKKTEMAELIKPFCKGIPQDLHPVYERDLLFAAADAVYEYVVDHTANVRAKN